MLLDLLKAGLATTKRERMVAGGRQTDVARVRIREAGRQALARCPSKITLMRKPSCLISCSHWLPRWRRSSNANGLVAKIRQDLRESARLFKGIICDDISEFESYMPSHAVGLLQVRSPAIGTNVRSALGDTRKRRGPALPGLKKKCAVLCLDLGRCE